MALVDHFKPVSGQFGVVLDHNHVFLCLFVLLDTVNPVLGQFVVVLARKSGFCAIFGTT